MNPKVMKSKLLFDGTLHCLLPYFEFWCFIICGKEVMFYGSVGLSFCWSVCSQHYLKSYERIAMKFYGGIWDGKRNKWLDFGTNPDHHADCPIGNLAII